MQIDFSAAFERVNHQETLYKLCSVGIRGSVLSVLTQFSQICHRTIWYAVVGVNWLTSFQECRRAVFWAHYCSSCAPRSFAPFYRIS